MRVIVAGSRSFCSFRVLSATLDEFIGDARYGENIEIVSGGARGADKFGEVYAQREGFGLQVFPADWHRYGKRAGMVRNELMAKYATHLVAFWDGKSAGTRNMIELGRKHGLVVKVVRF
jgi:hypothetical protein